MARTFEELECLITLLRTKNEALSSSRASTQAQLAAAQATVEKLSNELSESQFRLSMLESRTDYDDLHRELAATRQLAAARSAEAAEALAALSGARAAAAEVDRLQSENERLSLSLQREQATSDVLRSELEAVQTRLAAAENDAAMTARFIREFTTMSRPDSPTRAMLGRPDTPYSPQACTPGPCPRPTLHTNGDLAGEASLLPLTAAAQHSIMMPSLIHESFVQTSPVLPSPPRAQLPPVPPTAQLPDPLIPVSPAVDDSPLLVIPPSPVKSSPTPAPAPAPPTLAPASAQPPASALLPPMPSLMASVVAGAVSLPAKPVSLGNVRLRVAITHVVVPASVAGTFTATLDMPTCSILSQPAAASAGLEIGAVLEVEQAPLPMLALFAGEAVVSVLCDNVVVGRVSLPLRQMLEMAPGAIFTKKLTLERTTCVFSAVFDPPGIPFNIQSILLRSIPLPEDLPAPMPMQVQPIPEIPERAKLEWSMVSCAEPTPPPPTYPLSLTVLSLTPANRHSREPLSVGLFLAPTDVLAADVLSALAADLGRPTALPVEVTAEVTPTQGTYRWTPAQATFELAAGLRLAVVAVGGDDMRVVASGIGAVDGQLDVPDSFIVSVVLNTLDNKPFGTVEVAVTPVV